MSRRAAVVIGINRTGGLTPLRTPAEGSEALGIWLRANGFDPVKVFNDKCGVSVSPAEISTFIKNLIDEQTCEQLLIYFSGHGLWKNMNEFWLLSDAPQDANAAISFQESMFLAKDCGIPSVIFISDACRTLPRTKQQECVRGSVIFPNEPIERSQRAKIDKFLAAVETDPAYEIRIDGKFESVFTYCLRQAYRSPDPDMIRKIIVDGEKINVVPNKKLELFLRRKMSEVLTKESLKIDQAPDVEVLSDDDVYIARVEADELLWELAKITESVSVSYWIPTRSNIFPLEIRLFRSVIRPVYDGTRSLLRGWHFLRRNFVRHPPEPVGVPTSISDVAAVEIASALEEHPPVFEDRGQSVSDLSHQQFNRALEAGRRVERSVERFESQTGFVVIGSGVKDAASTRGMPTYILDGGDDSRAAVIRFGSYENVKPGTTVVRFTSGAGAALAALPGYIGHVVVENGGVAGVNYVPSSNNNRWPEYVTRRETIDRLRAAASAAAQFGVFRINDRATAQRLAEHIREEKRFDPALGLYAAYAYSQAGLEEEVNSVSRYMFRDLDSEMFDISMLAGTFHNQRDPWNVIVPFCPMLSQGWNLLRSRGIRLSAVLDDAQDNLERSLWTTFNPGRTNLIFDALAKGELT